MQTGPFATPRLGVENSFGRERTRGRMRYDDLRTMLMHNRSQQLLHHFKLCAMWAITGMLGATTVGFLGAFAISAYHNSDTQSTVGFLVGVVGTSAATLGLLFAEYKCLHPPIRVELDEWMIQSLLHAGSDEDGV